MQWLRNARARAHRPACRLTPVASYIVITVKQRATAKRELPRPNSKATAVVTACKRGNVSKAMPTGTDGSILILSTLPTAVREECDEGMPPESTIALISHTPCL